MSNVLCCGVARAVMSLGNGNFSAPYAVWSVVDRNVIGQCVTILLKSSFRQNLQKYVQELLYLFLFLCVNFGNIFLGDFPYHLFFDLLF